MGLSPKSSTSNAVNITMTKADKVKCKIMHLGAINIRAGYTLSYIGRIRLCNRKKYQAAASKPSRILAKMVFICGTD